MAGNNNSGRTRVDDPRYVKSVRIPVSTLVQIAELSELLGVSESKIIQESIDAHVGVLYHLTVAQKQA